MRGCRGSLRRPAQWTSSSARACSHSPVTLTSHFFHLPGKSAKKTFIWRLRSFQRGEVAQKTQQRQSVPQFAPKFARPPPKTLVHRRSAPQFGPKNELEFAPQFVQRCRCACSCGSRCAELLRSQDIEVPRELSGARPRCADLRCSLEIDGLDELSGIVSTICSTVRHRTRTPPPGSRSRTAGTSWTTTCCRRRTVCRTRPLARPPRPPTAATPPKAMLAARRLALPRRRPWKSSVCQPPGGSYNPSLAVQLISRPSPFLAAHWPRGAEWCCHVARTATTVCCSFRHRERRRRSLRRFAAPTTSRASIIGTPGWGSSKKSPRKAATLGQTACCCCCCC